MSYLRYLCLFTHSSVQHICCCVSVLFVFVLCTLCCQFSLDCPFLIVATVFSNVFFRKIVLDETESICDFTTKYLVSKRSFNSESIDIIHTLSSTTHPNKTVLWWSENISCSPYCIYYIVWNINAIFQKFIKCL